MISKTLKIVLLFINLFTISYSQTMEEERNWLIKCNITSLVDIFSFPTIQLSAEKELKSNMSINAEIGYQLFSLFKPDTVFLRPKGFKANFEYRYYLSKIFNRDVSDGYYIGLQGFYRQNQYTSSIVYITSVDPENRKCDFFGVKKSIVGLNLIFGYEHSISENLVLDFYGGLGGMNRLLVNTNKEFNINSGDHLDGIDFEPLFYALNLSESSGVFISFTFGVRMGFKI